MTVEIKIDDEIAFIEPCLSLKEVLAKFGYANEKIAITLNHKFIPKALHGTVIIQSNDRIDMIVPMQGG